MSGWCAKILPSKHPEVVKAFAKSAIDAQQPYIANPDVWLKQPENISKLARLSGVPEGDVPGLVKGNTYLTPQQQTAELTGPGEQSNHRHRAVFERAGQSPRRSE